MATLTWIWGLLQGFWRFLVALKDVIITVTVILLFLIFLRSLFSADGAPTVPDGSALQLTLDGYVVEQRTEVDPLVALTDPMAASLPSQTLLRDVLDAIDLAAGDKRIKALTLELDGFAGAGPASLESIGEALKRFKATGKPIFAHGLYYTDKSYYLAAHAGRVSLDPMGAVMLTGYGSYNLYMKEALDKLRVNVNVFRVGKYKSAVEPYTRSDMSPEAREESQALFDILWDKYRADVEAIRARGVNIDAAVEGALSGVPALKGDIAAYALQNRLVDRLETHEAFVAEVAKVVGEDTDDDGIATYNAVSMEDFLFASRALRAKKGGKIAVVYAAGDIIDGDHPAGIAGGDTVARLLRRAANDDSVKAVVLRIDSPGGSVTASEIIRRAVEDTRKAGKPVVASMGTLAASGGYWIATGADAIFAQPTTVTGSIGIFGMIPTFENTAAMLGARSDGVGTTSLSSAEDITQGFSEPVKALIQSTVEHGYTQFITRVSTARKLTPDQVNDIAQGRVWAGATARQLKLVDQFGDLEDAVASAARRAGLKTWHVDYMEEPETVQMRLLRFLTGTGDTASRARAAPRGVALAPVVDQLMRASLLLTGQSLRDRNNLYAYCAECTALAPPRFMPAARPAARSLMNMIKPE